MSRIVATTTLFMATMATCNLPTLANANEGFLERGAASYYASHFNGRQMASGERFNPNSTAAAHRTLPFGTVALVTNLSNGQSTTVVIRDRGPHVRGRILDVSPRTADELGMRASGVAAVELRPVRFPPPRDD
jgi:rare lipoprotein A